MEKYNSLAEKMQAEPSVYRFICNPDAFKNVQSCQTASSLLGTDPNTDEKILVAVTCKRWGCEYCAKVKIKRLSWLTHNANPNRLLTLTIDPAMYESPRDAFEQTSIKVPELVRMMRKESPEFEYLRVTEVTKQGFPHYHMLVRSSFIHHSKFKKAWTSLTGAKIVDVRQVHNTFSAYHYLVKYLTKMHKLDWTERHVSYSRNFFRPEDLEKFVFAPMENIQKVDEHPFEYLASRYPDEEIEMRGNGRYVIPYETCGAPLSISKKELGLANDVEYEGHTIATEVLLPYMQDAYTKEYE